MIPGRSHPRLQVVVVAAAIMLLSLWGLFRRDSASTVAVPTDAGSSVAAEEGGGGGGAARRPGASRQREVVLGEADQGLVVAGSVRGEDGTGVEGARVSVFAKGDSPFAELPVRGFSGGLSGAAFLTDAAGEFRAEIDRLPEGGAVLVRLSREARFSIAETKQWITPPDENVDFIVRVERPLTITAELVGEGARAFTFRVAGPDGSVHSRRADAGSRVEVQLREALADQELSASVKIDGEVLESRVLVLGAGESRHLEFSMVGSLVRGQVVRASDAAPIPGARVFAGAIDDLRGDEPFSVPRFERISAVVANANGEFVIRSSAKEITAWHQGYSSATEAVDDFVTLRLGRLGRVRGDVLGSDSVQLDDGEQVLAEDNGAFAFEGVCAGVHWLSVGEECRYGFTISAGGDLDLGVLSVGGEAEILLPPAEGLPTGGYMFLVDQVAGRPGGLLEVISAVVQNGVARAAAQRKVYTLVGMGFSGSIAIQSGVNELAGSDIGITVNARPGSWVTIVPEAEYEQLRLLAQRVPVQIPSSGELELRVFGGGLFRVWNEDSSATVEVGAVPASADLRN